MSLYKADLPQRFNCINFSSMNEQLGLASMDLTLQSYPLIALRDCGIENSSLIDHIDAATMLWGCKK